MNDNDWKVWFNKYGQSEGAKSYTNGLNAYGCSISSVDELFQAFKARLISELKLDVKGE